MSAPGRLEQQIRTHPKVRKCWDERAGGDGFWAILKPGWSHGVGGAHSVNGTLREVWCGLQKELEPCACPECLAKAGGK